MLRIKHTPHIHLPRLNIFISHPLIFTPIAQEDDELIYAINNDVSLHDNNWTLSSAPDVAGLDQFWSGVERDIRDDPQWIRFSDE